MKHLPAAIWVGAVVVSSLASAKDPAPGWTLASSGVPAVALVSVKESRDAITLTFRNTSDKNIAAFTLVNAGPVPPGEQPWVRDCFTERVGCFPARGRDEAKIRPAPPRELKVAAVLFEDGAAAGDPGAIQYLKAMRAGAALEVEREKSVLTGVRGMAPAQERASGSRAVRNANANVPGSVQEAIATLQGIEIAGLTADRFEHGSDAEQSGFLRGVWTRVPDSPESFRRLTRVSRPEPPP